MFDNGLPLPFPEHPAKSVAYSPGDFNRTRPGFKKLFFANQAVAFILAHAKLET